MAKLMLFDPSLKQFAPFIGSIWSIGAKEQLPAANLKEFAAQITKHQKLDELILFFHGAPGQITLGNQGFGLADADLRKAFTKKTTIGVIRFEGCWVGERPGEMAQFGMIFDASAVAGFTWEHFTSIMTVPVERGDTAEAIGKRVSKYERWIADKAPQATNLAEQAKNSSFSTKILLEWFQVFSITKAAPYDTAKGETRTNFDRLGWVTYKRRADAEQKTITFKDTEETEFEPISKFQYVTVKK